MGKFFEKLLGKFFNDIFYFLLNRFIMFDNYRIPKESLLGKTGDINENGEYISPFKDKSKRLGNFKLFILYNLIKK